MIRSSLMSLLLLGLVFISCKNELKQTEGPKVESEEIATTEAIIRGFSVRDSAGTTVKDSLKAMQSMVLSDSGRELKNIFYNLDGSIAWEDRYVYNEEGYKTGSRFFEQGVNKITYKYDLDEQGRRVGYSAMETNSGVEMYNGFSKFLENGKVRMDGVPGPTGVVMWNYIYTFDEAGEELGYEFIGQDGKRYPSFYKVTSRDDQNRWTQRAIVENDTVVAIETREFKKLN